MLAIHSFGHQILAALPLTILASPNDVNFLVEKRGANDYAGQGERILLNTVHQW